MGVTYLQRAARRLATVGTPDGAASVRPAIPSRSPLALADQRLNLDSFAERFHAPLVSERATPMTDEAGAATTPPPERRPEEPLEAAPRPAADARPAPRAPRPGVHRQPTRTEVAGSGRRDVPPQAPTEPDPPAARPARRSARGDREPPAAPVRRPGRPARPATASPSPSPPARTEAARPRSRPAPAADEGRAPAPEPVRAASADVTGGAAPPAGDAAAQPMLHALSRAMSWVEGQPHRRPERERVEGWGTPAAVARPPSGDIVPMRPARAAARERAQPVTHLEIGRIEVEIVPPPTPAPQVASHRSPPRTNGPGGARRQPFGWRQR